MVAAILSAAILITGSSTGYHTCEGSTSMTSSGRTAKVGYVASNGLPLGTWIEMRKPRSVMGRRFFQVWDVGGMPSSSDLDFWASSCSWMNSWGRKTVTYKVIRKSELYRGKPIDGWSFKPTKKGAKLIWKG